MKNKARTKAIQHVYLDILSQYSNHKFKYDTADDLTQEELDFFSKVLKITREDSIEIDKIILSHLSNKWTIQRLPKVVHAILRLAISELMISDKSLHKKIINDYLNLAKTFNHEQEVGFINKLLNICVTSIGKTV